MICIRRARPDDAAGIGAVHVAAWRSAYAGLLPDAYLTNLSAVRHAAQYGRGIADRREGHAIFVAVASGADAPRNREMGGESDQEAGMVVGFTSGGRARRPRMAEGEVETLYLLDDYRERGIGRRLMRAMAAHLAAVGCRSVNVWVLQSNPSSWFYRHLGGKLVAREIIRFAGMDLPQMAFMWEPIDALLTAKSF